MISIQAHLLACSEDTRELVYRQTYANYLLAQAKGDWRAMEKEANQLALYQKTWQFSPERTAELERQGREMHFRTVHLIEFLKDSPEWPGDELPETIH